MSPETNSTFTGGCICGAVRYTINRPSLKAIDCHCSMCRRLHASDYATYLMVWPNEVSWQGEDNLTTYTSSEGGVREFCKNCGTTIRARGQSPDGREEITAGSLDDDPKIETVGHIFVTDKGKNYEITKPAPQFERGMGKVDW